MARQSATSSRRIEAASKRKEILRLKIQRFANSEIADMLGCTRQHVHAVLQESKAEWAEEANGYLEQLSNEREAAHQRMLVVVRKLLENIEKGIVIEQDPESGEATVTEPDFKSIDRLAVYEKLMAETYGYGAPKRADVTSNGETITGPVASYTVPVIATMAEWTKQSLASAAADASAAEDLLAEGDDDEDASSA